MQTFGKMLILLGGLLVIVGAIFMLGGRLGLGKLPGDIYYQKGNTSFYFPLVSCIIVSIVLSVLLNLIGRR
jgi:multisubunit Na+/H+ antiporter MnhG subunit